MCPQSLPPSITTVLAKTTIKPILQAGEKKTWKKKFNLQPGVKKVSETKKNPTEQKVINRRTRKKLKMYIIIALSIIINIE